MKYILLHIYNPPILAKITECSINTWGNYKVEFEWIDESGLKRTGSSGGRCKELGKHYGHAVIALYHGEERHTLLKTSDEFMANISRLIGLLEDSLENYKNKQQEELKEQEEKDKNALLIAKQLEAAELRRKLVIERLNSQFESDYINAQKYWQDYLQAELSYDEFSNIRTKFLINWSQSYPVVSLDEEQASAVAEYGPHIQVTARAGSGKTRTLVARALFLITHCKIPASSILVLAFNKKAVNEIRERLGKILNEDQLPHILTFHALAHRIVRPQETLIYDDVESQEGQTFSTTIQRIIDEQLRGGPLEQEFRTLMAERWTTELEQIIQNGFNLSKEEFLNFRLNVPRFTINGRRLKSEVHKHIGNTLLRHRLHFSYGKTIFSYSGTSYAPDFCNFDKETERRIIIEVQENGINRSNPARDAFWKSDRASNALLLQVPEGISEDENQISLFITNGLRALGVRLYPMSDDELWEAVKDRAIGDFTKAVKGFIARCQKELITKEQLSDLIDKTSPQSNCIQVLFWRLCQKIFKLYLNLLAVEKKTDFDQLMLRAAGMISEGETRFSSARGAGNLRTINHVLIDEFQDFSHLFNELRKAITAQNPNAMFFCVGDDWQAINKFAGADLRYFIGFQEFFQPSVRKLISRNYRSFKRIVETGNQVMINEGEPSVPIHVEQGNVHLVDANQTGKLSEIEELVKEEMGELAVPILRIASRFITPEHDVVVLSRTGNIPTPDGILTLESWKRKLQQFLPDEQRKQLLVSTIHGYKGKESEVVVLLAPENYPHIHPDAIFGTIFGDTIESNIADEKRLFYVGVTRAKSRLFLVAESALDARVPEIPFLPGPTPSLYDINQLIPRLVCGNKVVVQLANKLGGPKDIGTFPIKDILKQMGWNWSAERKAWSRFLYPGSINSPLECVQYLNAQPWIKEADGILASFVWEEQRHQFSIARGQITKDNSAIPVQQQSANSHTSSILPFAPKPHAPPAPVVSISQKNVSKRSLELPKTNTATTPDIFETAVVGMQYSGRTETATRLDQGDFIKLQREPGNKHDSNAIQVMTSQGEQIGYINRRIASHLAKGLDAWGGSWNARVRTVFYQPPPHKHASVKICFPLPPGVTIPDDLCNSDQVEENPFGSPMIKEYERPQGLLSEDNTSSGVDAAEEPLASPGQNPISQTIVTDDNSHAIDWSALSQHQRELLENLIEPRLAPIIAELYLDGCSDWPEIGYEGRDATGRCTGTMLEVAWLDFRIGVAIPSNDFRSFVEAGWTIIQASTATSAELRQLFQARSELSSRASGTPNPQPIDFTDIIKRIQQGSFHDEDPDDDIPY